MTKGNPRTGDKLALPRALAGVLLGGLEIVAEKDPPTYREVIPRRPRAAHQLDDQATAPKSDITGPRRRPARRLPLPPAHLDPEHTTLDPAPKASTSSN